MTTAHTGASRRDAEVTWRDIPGGPTLLRGADSYTDADGVRHPVTRPVVAICRCGGSQRKPWCDGVHKLLAARDGAREAAPRPAERFRGTA